jgi:iron complex outermembrane receptor protein
MTWSPRPEIHLYANYATSFETPTFTELANPARDTGFNTDLGGFNNVKAQTAVSFEIGLKTTLIENVYFDVAAYTMQVDDEISNVSTTGSRGVFTNADTDRSGIEASIAVSLFAGLEWTSAYTYSNFEFDSVLANIAWEGNELPGLPQNQFYTELAYTHDSGLYLIWDLLYVDKFFANNANTTTNSSSTVANIRAGYKTQLGNWLISPYIGLHNMFDESYNANVRINGFGGRLLEPAPDLNAYGGLTFRYNL